MADLQVLHSQARKLILRINEGLERIEASEVLGRSIGTSVQFIKKNFKELEKISNEMDSTWRMYIIKENSNKGDIWKRKVEKVSEDVEIFRKSLHRFEAREANRIRENKERQELFSRRKEGAVIAKNMDEESQMAKSIESSKTIIEEAYDMGSNVLENMTKNRNLLKGTQKKILDVISGSNMSHSILKMTERRQKADALITYGGMVIIIIIIFGIWWYFM